jgi:uncharacterized protein involved in response to NO
MREANALWQLAFRPGFLGAAACAVVAVSAWIGVLSGWWTWRAPFSAHWWHAHEMLFGFAMPVVTGFLLTAVRTWTGTDGTQGLRLQILFAAWLGARLVLALLPEAWYLALALDSLFVLLSLNEFWQRVWSVRQWRNIPISLVLLAMLSLNIASYLWREDPVYYQRIHFALVFVFVLLITVIGGRVIPFFTSRRLQYEQVPGLRWLEHACLAGMIFLVIATLSGTLGLGAQSTPAWQLLLTVVAVLQLWRFLRWRFWETLHIPLLWSLHIAYLFIPLGLFSLAFATNAAHTASLIHLLAIATIGGMILAMMARVSLGHTGRPLEPPRTMTLAFALLTLSALLRAFLPMLLPATTLLAWQLAGLAWVIAFGLFFAAYYSVLIKPRVDGKPG